jgi:uncharacterized SAM-binding protein YcdF (DUF218 family)
MDSLFFYLSKLVWLVTAPDMLWLELLILAFLMAGTARFRKAGRRLAALLLVLAVLVVATKPAQWVARPLENRFPHPAWPACVDGILMLGGGEKPLITAGRGVPEIDSAAPRLFAAVELLRRYPEARLIFTGGSGDPLAPEPSEASTVKAVLEQLGVDLGRVRFEDRSRNTWENEVNAMAMAMAEPKPEQRWVLVTSALHMPRSVGIARQLGWAMLPWPVDYSTLPDETLHSEGHFGKYLDEVDIAFREWLGLLAYRLSGRSAELFPAPEPEPDSIRCDSTSAPPQ